MAGYLNEEQIILDEWYQIFAKKYHILSQQDHDHWQHIKTLGLSKNSNKNNWKCFPIQEFLKYNFITDIKNSTLLNTSQYEKLILPIDSYKLVFINGKLSTIFSDLIISPWIIKVIPYRHPDQYKMFEPIQPDIFSYLTKCLSDAIVHIKLPAGKKTNKPLYLLYINEGSNTKNELITSYNQYYLDIEHNTNASIIEHFISINDNKYFNGTYTSTKIGNYAKLHHVRLIFENRFSYHTSYHDVNLGHSANMDSNTFFILGPKFTYHKTNVVLNHSKSCLSLNNLMLLGNTDVGNICTYLEHNNHNYSLSRQLHKIIACNSSNGTFDGLIKVNQNSVKTDGKMTNNNLLLHKNATIHSTPKLEIYSDNVQCSHGATIGQINTDHLFYLITRGISEKDALKMLIYAFATEVTETIQNNVLKNIILTRIDQTLTRSLYDDLSYRKN